MAKNTAYELGFLMAKENAVALTDMDDVRRAIGTTDAQAAEQFLAGWRSGGGFPPLAPLPE